MSENERKLELTVDSASAYARVGECEPFPFNFEHLGFVTFGMSYQAWGAGCHFVFRKTGRGFSAEFQGPEDRSPAVCHLSETELQSLLSELEDRSSPKTRVQML